MDNGTTNVRETPNVELKGWEIVCAADGSRWIGKVIDDGEDWLTMQPVWEVIPPTTGPVAIPQSNGQQIIGMGVEWPVSPGGNVVPVLNDIESLPRVRVRAAARVELGEMSKAQRNKLRHMFAGLLEKAAPSSHSNVVDFGGSGPKVQ